MAVGSKAVGDVDVTVQLSIRGDLADPDFSPVSQVIESMVRGLSGQARDALAEVDAIESTAAVARKAGDAASAAVDDVGGKAGELKDKAKDALDGLGIRFGKKKRRKR